MWRITDFPKNQQFATHTHLLPLVRAGTKFIDGVQEDRAKNVTQSTENQPREAA